MTCRLTWSRKPGSEAGTALLTALLMVALMAAVTVQLVDAARFSMFRTVNTDRRDQAYWYALGAREFTESILLQSGEGDRAVMRPQEPWLRGRQLIPIDRGSVAGEIHDGNNCLNLNALADETPPQSAAADPATRGPSPRRMLTVLLEQLGAPPVQIEALKAQIIDWIDTDTAPEPGGAEDQDYLSQTPPYRAANQPFLEVEELLALPAMTPQLFAALKPFVCARPEPAQQALNPNTLRLEEAVLMVALFEGRLAPGQVEALLLQRPVNGYDSVQAVLATPQLAELQSDLAIGEMLTLRSRWFDMEVAVELDGTLFSLSQTVELTPAGRLRRLSQRFGPLQ